jgi:hypothetical protein
MSKQTIEEMAREVGMLIESDSERGSIITAGPHELFSFAALVRADEREACAKVCDDIFETWCKTSGEHDDHPAPRELAAAIRARGTP